MNFLQHINKTHIVLMGLILAAGWFSTGCSQAEAESPKKTEVIRPVKAIELSSNSQVRDLLLPAKAQAPREVDLSFRVDGTLIQFNVDTGMLIKKGSVVAMVDPRDYQVAVKSAEAGLALAKANLEQTELQFKRYQKLIKNGSAAKATYDQAKSSYEVAKARLDASAESLRSARNTLIDTTLYAPFTGYVQETSIENHETVKTGNPIARLVDLSHMELSVDLPEDLLFKAGQFNGFICRFDALPGREFKARFKDIGKTPNRSNSTYPLILTLEDAESGQVMPGMSAEVKILLDASQSSEYFVVPMSALLSREGQETRVWVFDDKKGTVSAKPVELHGMTPKGVAISGDLARGEWVVTRGVHYLVEGQQVRLLKKPSASNIGQEL